jgi:hypothetical protein
MNMEKELPVMPPDASAALDILFKDWMPAAALPPVGAGKSAVSEYKDRARVLVAGEYAAATGIYDELLAAGNLTDDDRRLIEEVRKDSAKTIEKLWTTKIGRDVLHLRIVNDMWRDYKSDRKAVLLEKAMKKVEEKKAKKEVMAIVKQRKLLG